MSKLASANIRLLETHSLLRDTKNVKHFKNEFDLSICVDDEKGKPGKPCGPATGIPGNNLLYVSVCGITEYFDSFVL